MVIKSCQGLHAAYEVVGKRVLLFFFFYATKKIVHFIIMTYVIKMHDYNIEAASQPNNNVNPSAKSILPPTEKEREAKKYD